MSDITLNVKTRTETGKEVARKMRREGRIPGIYYHHQQENISFDLDKKELAVIWGHEAALITVKFDDKDEKKCIIRDIQFDPIKDSPIHIDLMGIKMDEQITVSVPVTLVGSASGVKEGGILQTTMREIEIKCLPGDIPEHLEVDVTELNIGDSLSTEDVASDKFEFVSDQPVVLATVSAPKVVEEDVESEEGDEEEVSAEPEVLKQKDEE